MISKSITMSPSSFLSFRVKFPTCFQTPPWDGWTITHTNTIVLFISSCKSPTLSITSPLSPTPWPSTSLSPNVRLSSIFCETQFKIGGALCSKAIKNFKTVTAEHLFFIDIELICNASGVQQSNLVTFFFRFFSIIGY